MSKTKKKTQNTNLVKKQSMHKMNSVQKTKNPKIKNVSDNKIALRNNSKLQNKNKPSQEINNKPQNKLVNKKMKEKELKADDSDDTGSSNSSGESIMDASTDELSITGEEEENDNLSNSNKLQNKSANKGMKKKESKVNNSDDESRYIYEESTDSDTSEEEEESDNLSNSNELQNKPANKEMKKNELEINTSDEESSWTDGEEEGDDVSDLNKSQNKPVNEKMKKSELEIDDSESSNMEEWVSEEEDFPDILGKSLADDSEEDDEDFEEDKNDEDFEENEDDNDDDSEVENTAKENENKKNKTRDENENNGQVKEYQPNYINIEDIEKEVLEEIKEGRYMPFPDGTVNRTTIKILNLPKDITEDKIKNKFQEFGVVKKVQLKREKSEINANQSNHPFVEALLDYYSPISAKRAFSMSRKLFEGNTIIVQYTDGPRLIPIFDSNKCVWLSNLLFGIDNNTIWRTFSHAGEIEYVKVFRNKTTGFSLGFGFVAYTTRNGAKEALKLNNVIMLNSKSPVRVQIGYPNWLLRLINKRLTDKAALPKETKEVENSSENAQHENTDDNPSKKLKNNSGEAVARKTENEKQKPQKKKIGSVEKNQTPFQGQKANFKQKKKNKKFNKQKKEMAKKLAAKPNKPGKV